MARHFLSHLGYICVQKDSTFMGLHSNEEALSTENKDKEVQRGLVRGTRHEQVGTLMFRATLYLYSFFSSVLNSGDSEWHPLPPPTVAVYLQVPL